MTSGSVAKSSGAGSRGLIFVEIRHIIEAHDLGEVERWA